LKPLLCPSVRPPVPYFLSFLLLESRKFEYKLSTMYLPGVWPEFSIRGLKVLGLGLEPNPIQMGFFGCF
jgi:hypothetical protein